MFRSLAVLLAFVVIVVWEDLGTAEERSSHEAGVFGDLMRDTTFMNEPLRSEFRKELLEYGHSVIEQEWPRMANGESERYLTGFTGYDRIDYSPQRAQS